MTCVAKVYSAHWKLWNVRNKNEEGNKIFLINFGKTSIENAIIIIIWFHDSVK